MEFKTYLQIAYTIVSMSHYYDRLTKAYICYKYTVWIGGILYAYVPSKRGLKELEELKDDEELHEWEFIEDEPPPD